jgi:hypothetical protein
MPRARPSEIVEKKTPPDKKPVAAVIAESSAD